jgi:hypothetical protein
MTVGKGCSGFSVKLNPECPGLQTAGAALHSGYAHCFFRNT